VSTIIYIQHIKFLYIRRVKRGWLSLSTWNLRHGRGRGGWGRHAGVGGQAPRCGRPRCRGLRNAVEYNIQLETEECVRGRLPLAHGVGGGAAATWPVLGTSTGSLKRCSGRWRRPMAVPCWSSVCRAGAQKRGWRSGALRKGAPDEEVWRPWKTNSWRLLIYYLMTDILNNS
jgi:hypothetical protein